MPPVFAAVGAAFGVSAGTAALATIGLGLSVYGQVSARQQQKKAAAAAAEADRAATNRANLKVARERRRVAAQARAEKAEVIQASGNLGATKTSAALGAAGSISTRGSAEQGFLNTSNQLTNQQSIFQQLSANYTSKAAGYAAIADFGGTVFQYSESLGTAAGNLKSRLSRSAGASSAGAAPSGVTLSSGGFRGDTPYR